VAPTGSERLLQQRRRLRAVVRNSPEHIALALQAADDADAVLHLFEAAHPDDKRPRAAIEAIRAWAGGARKLSMAEVRKLSLDSHAAAREAATEAATFAARAAGHAIATWHVPTHALGAPAYAAKAKAASEGRPPGKLRL
jgi:hypothetical protein